MLETSLSNPGTFSFVEILEHADVTVPKTSLLGAQESACRARGLGLTAGLGGSPGDGKGCPLQYSGLENSKDCIVHGVAESQT